MVVTALALTPRKSLDQIKNLVLTAVSSPLTKAMYGKALDDFFVWWFEQGEPPLSRWVVQAHRTWLEEKRYAPSTINQRLAAVRKLAREAAINGLLAAETAAGIAAVPGAKLSGNRIGNWLTVEQVQSLLGAPDAATCKGIRDRAILALLIGCGLRRAEASGLRMEDLQQRDGRSVIVDLRGKHGRIRSVPVPGWVRQAIEEWTHRTGIIEGPVFRSVNRKGDIGNSISPNALLDVVSATGRQVGLQIKPHDLRRTCAKLCRGAGGDLEQIQFLLGHASIQTTERYLGTKQDLVRAPNDRFGF